MWSLVSTRTLRTFSVKLLFSWMIPSIEGAIRTIESESQNRKVGNDLQDLLVQLVPWKHWLAQFLLEVLP